MHLTFHFHMSSRYLLQNSQPHATMTDELSTFPKKTLLVPFSLQYKLWRLVLNVKNG